MPESRNHCCRVPPISPAGHTALKSGPGAIELVDTHITATAAGVSNDWVWTRDFILGGKMFNLGYLSPGGGTISNYASAVPVSTTVPGFPTPRGPGRHHRKHGCGHVFE